MKEIPLTRGHVALVDDEDFERVNQHKWCVMFAKNNRKYAVRMSTQVNGKRHVVYLHRFVLNLPRFCDDEQRRDADHEDHNGLNNQKYNLRVATRSQNLHNKRKKVDASSKYKGVYFRKDINKWQAQIKIDKKQTNLGYFETEIQAAEAYKIAAKEHYKDFCYAPLL